MAGENGNRISAVKLAVIQAEWEAGIDTQTNIAKKHRISRRALIRNANRLNWKWGEKHSIDTKLITQKAAEIFIKTETNKLIDYTTAHLNQIKNIKSLTVFTAKPLLELAKEKKKLDEITQAEAKRLWTIQRFLKLNAETHDLVYKSERLAMGLDKDKERDNTLEERIAVRMAKLKT